MYNQILCTLTVHTYTYSKFATCVCTYVYYQYLLESATLNQFARSKRDTHESFIRYNRCNISPYVRMYMPPHIM